MRTSMAPESEPVAVKVITLEVKIDVAEKLAMAENGGKLRLALRSPLNPDIKKTTGADFNALVKSHQLIPPKPKGSQRMKVEVINGTKSTTRRF
jgi:Flp pilus assembly protein CpaB